jgi:sugar transferase EpsL
MNCKRIIDVTVATGALGFGLPVLLVVACLVRINLGKGVFFKQDRAGLHGKPFKMFKFRTMTDERDVAGELLPDAMRLTGFGRFLRSSSLDELPELWNVLRGDMSLVGPRPLLMDYLDLYSERQARRHLVRPGLTGWAQINGRNDTTWAARLENDVWYVEHRSLSLDVRILLKTMAIVVSRSGISARGEATMQRFRGGSE